MASKKKAAAGRAQFTDEQKRAIVAEASAPGTTVSKVLKKHRLNQSTFYNWKKKISGGAASTTGSSRGKQSKNGAASTAASDRQYNRVLRDLKNTKSELLRELQRISKAIAALEG